MLVWPFGPKETKEARFWRWFAEHEAQLYDLEKDRDRVFNLVGTALSKVQRDLTFEFSGIRKDSGVREFVVSADGIRSAFPAVEKLVAVAPAFPRWRVVAFRQPSKLDGKQTLTMDGIEIQMDDVLVAIEPQADLYGLTVYLPEFRETPGRSFEKAAYILLDMALGEYAVETRIGTIEIAGPSPFASNLIPLTELSRYIETHTAGGSH